MTFGTRHLLAPIALLVAVTLCSARRAQAQVGQEAEGAETDTASEAAAETEPGVDTPRSGTLQPAPASRSSAAGQYVDTAGAVRDFDVEYARQLETPSAHHVRTWTMMAGGLTALSLGYWLGMDREVADWDNPRPQQRFDGTAWRTDNNALSVNYILHPMAGGLAYSFARANHHGVAGSAAYGFLASFLWEFVLEFKEKVSVNDIVVTPTTAIPLGEFMYKLGIYLDSAQTPSLPTKVAQWGLGTAVRTDRALDDRQPAPVAARDRLGLTSEIWHDFEFDYGFHMTTAPSRAERVVSFTGLRGKLVSLPGYLRPGRFGRAFWRADLAWMAAWGEFSGHGAGVGITSDVLLAGYHAQNVEGHREPTRGQAVTTGVSTAYRYLESMAFDVSEKFAAWHMPGPAIDWHAFGRHWDLGLSARAHPDYVGAGVLGLYPEWTAAHPGERGKHVTRIQGYYYGWGGSGELAARLRVGPVLLRGQIFYGQYRSEEGNNRWQERITIDVPMGTELLFYQGDVQLQPPGSPVAVGVGASVRHWETWVGELHRRAHLLSRGLQVSARF